MIEPKCGNDVDFETFIKTLRNYPHDVTTLKTFWKLAKRLKACLFIRRTGPCLGQLLVFMVDELPKVVTKKPQKILRKGDLFCPLPKEQTLVFYENFITVDECVAPEYRSEPEVELTPEVAPVEPKKRGRPHGSGNKVSNVIRKSRVA